jgi:O-antigen/teichoic acid export membrane protein
MAKRYSHFPKFNVVSGLFEKGSGQIPIIMLSMFFGASVTGFFSFSQRIIAAPGSLIGVSIGDVFRQHASIEYKEKGNCHGTFLKLFRLLVLVAVIPFTIILLFSPSIFSFVFGAEWRIAGEYAQIMTVMFFLSFVVSPLSNMFIIAEKQDLDLVIQIILFTFVVISFIAGYRIFNHPKIAIALYTIIYSIKYCIEFYLSLQFSRGKFAVVRNNLISHNG